MPEIFAVDLDDVLTRTKREHARTIRDAARFISYHTGHSPASVVERIKSALDAGYEEVGVDPDLLWSHAWNNLGLDPALRNDIFSIWMRAYSVVPKLHQGAMELLDYIESTKIPAVVVSHGRREWIDLKTGETGIAEHPAIREIIALDPREHKHKGISAWSAAFDAAGVEAKDSEVIDDNLSSIVAVSQLGVATAYWVRRRINWRVYAKGEKPHGAVPVPNLWRLIDVLKRRGDAQ